jgi:hypothetical protein
MDPATGKALLTIGGAFLGGIFGNRGNDKQAEASKKAALRQLKYDQEAYNRDWMKLNADRAWAMEGIRIQQANDEKAASYRDAVNQQQYLYQLAIRHREQASLEAQFAKSNELFTKTVTQNAKAAQTATDSELRKLDEIHTESTFDAQEQRLEYLQKEGAIRARGVSGVSVGKTQQSAMASFGQQVAMLNEGLASAGRNAEAMIDQIKDDKYSADLAAWAAKMQNPGILPMPIQPLITPRTEYQDIRPLNPDFDRPPEPILGGYYSSSAANLQTWGAAVPSIAMGLGNLFFG